MEETDALFPEERNRICLTGTEEQKAELSEAVRKSWECSFLCDRIRLDTAQPLAVYGDDFYQGEPCAAVNRFGEGLAYYVGTIPEDDFIGCIIEKICRDKKITAPYPCSEMMELTCREKENVSVIFAINYSDTPGWVDFGLKHALDLLGEGEVTGRSVIAGKDVRIFKILDL